MTQSIIIKRNVPTSQSFSSNFQFFESVFVNVTPLEIMSLGACILQAKQIPNKYQRIVFGFVHQMESITHSFTDSAYCDIPDEIIFIVLCFYYDYASFTKWGQGISISGTFNHILHFPTEPGVYEMATAYIGNPLDSMDDKIIKCKIKLASDNTEILLNWFRIFGICSDLHWDLNEDFDVNGQQFAYYVQPTGVKWKIDMDKEIDGQTWEYKGSKLNEASNSAIITLILDLPNTTLSFEQDGKSAEVCFEDVVRKEGVKYGIAVTVKEDICIEILSYSEVSDNK